MTDINLNQIASELYGRLITRFSSIEIGNENGEVLSKKQDVPNARFFEFPYKVDGMTLGTITLTLDSDDGLIVQLGGDLVDERHPDVQKWVKGIGQFCKRHLLNCKVVNLTKSNLDKRDYHFQAKKKEHVPMEPVMESKLYGTSKISYQDLGEARLVIRHNQTVNTELAAGRTQHIDSIYIENTQGERFRYPFKHLNGARALAEHVSNGGNPYDSIGKYITGLSEELSQLRKFKGYVTRHNGLAESMGEVTGRVMDRIESIKKEVSSLQRPSYYKAFAESFEATESKEIPETVMNDWVDRLTIRSFNEELKTVFPYIFKLVDESEIPVKEISPDDLLESEPASEEDMAQSSSYQELAPEDMFESFIRSIAEDAEEQQGTDSLFSENPEIQAAAVERLNGLLANEMPGGPQGVNAIQSLKGIIDDPELASTLAELDPNLDARPIVQQYILHRQPDLLPQLHFGNEDLGGGAAQGETPPPDMSAPPEGELPPPPAPGEEAAAPAPEETPPPAPGEEAAAAPAPAAGTPGMPPLPPQPVAESRITEGSAHGYNVVKWYDKWGDQGKLSKWLKKEAGLPKDAPLYFDSADLVWDDQTIVRNALVDPELKFVDLLNATIRASGQGQEFSHDQGVYRAHGAGEHEEVEDEGLERWNAKRKFGANGARALASAKKAGSYPGKMSKLRRKFIKAWESGVQLEDVMDFGYATMTVAEAIAAAGLTPMECGYSMPEEGDEVQVADNRSGEQEIMDSISGFWNREDDNFTIGGTRAKIKIKKAFENGEYQNATIDDVKAVMAKIDAADPTAHEQSAITKLAGVAHEPEIGNMSAKVASMGVENPMVKLLKIISK